MRERARYTSDPQERKEQAARLVADGFEGLVKELQAGRSERFLQYLSFCARFHRYSPYNQMLIWMQKPEATLVAGFQRWKELGYAVRKGERGLAILAPIPVKNKEATEPEETLVGFKVAYVFDVSQLANADQKPISSLIERLPDDAGELFGLVQRAVEASGIGFEVQPLRPGVHGMSLGGRIVLAEGWDSRNQTMTLLHEWAHELLHREWARGEDAAQLSREVRECQAEATSYVVSQALGLYNPFSRDYLLSYGTTAQNLVDNLDQVHRASHVMIETLEQQIGG